MIATIVLTVKSKKINNVIVKYLPINVPKESQQIGDVGNF